MEEKVLNQERVRELWAAIKAKLAEKVDSEKLNEYLKINDLDESVNTILEGYAKTSDVAELISTALADYINEDRLNSAIQDEIAKIPTMSVSVLDRLPDTGDEKVIYLIPAANSSDKNVKDEYLWVDGSFELIGSTTIDLTQYWSKDELSVMTSEELEEILK